MSRSFRAPGDPVPKNPPVYVPIWPASRRGLLGGLSALAVPSFPALADEGVNLTHPLPARRSEPHPDADLLTACAEHLRLAAEELRLLGVMRSFDLEDISAPAEAAEQAWDAACDRSGEAVIALMKRQALTYDGAAAKARSALVYRRSIANPGDTDADLSLEDLAALSVLRDLERLIGGEA